MVSKRISVCCLFINIILVLWATLKRSGEQKPPCFYDESLEGSRTDLTNHLHAIKRSLRELKAGAEIFRNAMANHCVNGHNGTQFIDVFEADVNKERRKFKRNFRENRTLFLDEMATRYKDLNLLAYYLEILQRTASETAKDNLRAFQNIVYVCMCSQKIALVSQGQPPLEVVPGGNLSDEFIQKHTDRDTRCKQDKLEYILAVDSQRLAEYLVKLYRSLKKTRACKRETTC